MAKRRHERNERTKKPSRRKSLRRRASTPMPAESTHMLSASDFVVELSAAVNALEPLVYLVDELNASPAEARLGAELNARVRATVVTVLAGKPLADRGLWIDHLRGGTDASVDDLGRPTLRLRKLEAVFALGILALDGDQTWQAQLRQCPHEPCRRFFLVSQSQRIACSPAHADAARQARHRARNAAAYRARQRRRYDEAKQAQRPWAYDR